jgi:hypothetical protein
MAVDGVLGDAQPARDLLGLQMLGDQPQAFTLARRQPLDRTLIAEIPHRRRGKSAFGVSSIADRPFPPKCCVLHACRKLLVE